MLFNDHHLNIDSLNKLHSPKKNFVTVFNRINLSSSTTELIRFVEGKEKIVWSHPDEIFFIKSADHYVKSLIKCGNQLKWMTRHNTLKELLEILPENYFIRLNRFYLLNLHHFSHFNEKEKLLYFNNDFFISTPHRISPFLRHLLNCSYT